MEHLDLGMNRPLVKVCCIQNADEAAMAVAHGARLLGLVSAMPSGAGPIAEEQIAAIAATVPPGIVSVLLTCLTGVDALVAQHRRCRTHAIQLVDALPAGALAELQARLPGIGLIQVIHVQGEESVGEARAAAPFVDAILLDSGNPAAAIKELGGTGRVHDWAISARIVETCGKPVFLAGGLRPTNVADAIHAVRPYGVDLCTGIRTPDGALDQIRLEAFMAAVSGHRATVPNHTGSEPP